MVGIEQRLAALEGRAAQTGERWGYDDADLAFLADGDIRFIIALQERGGELTEDERAAVAAIDEKVRVK